MPLSPRAHAVPPLPRLVSCAAACYMGAVCQSDSGSSSYGSFIALEGFLDCTDSKNYYYKGNWAEQRMSEKKKILYTVHLAAFAVPKCHKPPLNILVQHTGVRNKTH